MVKNVKILAAVKPRFWFTLVANNGQILMTSETYTRKSNAVKGMQAVIRAFAKGDIYQSYTDHTGAKKQEKEIA